MDINKAIQMLEAEYESAKRCEYIINPLAYALYRVWQKADEENRRKK